MQCPVDGTTLVMADRNGVEIDYCPQCRGVWLDRGELDKIIERSVQAPPPPPQDRGGYDERPRKKKRGGFLDELFDF
ncbi:zf-TFIIB domain-containing protein [Ponticoccus sp. SC2-23]|uniref:TFIIB-type zinc ribbon-containing protein n=1 Tax=Alexandriicola marinus TaxID=2081710 RepID=UPI000FDC7372|nr:zf-TFIIB domain-containing protein [Alexandriicola marinus]MBM1220213.1 zf-TFIIB domain-containing protein [Ponticoccus sp. SC6-9]MBM1224899.1 zf-TFIIB domain-containing protein [Ponticoccus sp. SC6-15]MBM1228413.1 zf-TFIIB domain-containing protein [Ponticoccus sp. SC6-38]MBM1233950.1 zf-TFIIB domain-containing protein [Ponticoccus sp. SC6-45]MBM1238914.1 zf-TFIIB domain-containing protein [Ponticoccus sp. SC6-49]MBM1242696.1 zf-TFIIB domain-containing protein [Ponticoccus sp. SC2-64]MBM